MPWTASTAAQLEDAIAAIPASGGEVSVYIEDDITLTQRMVIPSNSQVSLYGDGTKTINNASGQDRIINLDGVENSSLTISGVNLSQGHHASGYTRCVSAYQTTNCTINIYDSELNNAEYYPINVAGGNTNLKLNVENTDVNGWCAVNVWSPNTEINIKDSHFTCINNNSGETNAFAAVVFNAGSQNSVLNISNSSITTAQNGDQYEAFFIIKAADIAINSTNTIYKYTRLGSAQPEVYNSVEEVFDYNSWSTKYDDTVATSKFTLSLNAIDYTNSGSSLEYPFATISGISFSIYDIGEITDTSSFVYGEIAALKQTKVGANTFASPKLNVNGKRILMPCKLITE